MECYEKERDKPVIVGCLGIVENCRDLFQVGGTQHEGDIMNRYIRETGESLGRDLEDLLPIEGGNFHAF